jgi:predicted extracellular nuclease
VHPAKFRRALLPLLFLAALATPAGALEIWQIQGAGMSSPYAGQVVTTTGNVVTAVGPQGFFIQTPLARSDNDPETSDGIYVYTGASPLVATGDVVDVTGRVSEYHGMTEIGGSPQVTKRSSGSATPPAVELGPDRPSPFRPQPENEMERYEGMLVHVASGTVTGPTDQVGKIALVAREGRTFREPGIEFPGLPGLPVWDGNPEVFTAKLDALGGVAAAVPAGAHVDELEGPLAEYDGSYEVWPTSFSFTGTPRVRAVRPHAAGELTVATQNLYQLFDYVKNGTETVVSGEVYARRLAKHSRLVREVLGGPDVLAVQEVESLKVLTDLAGRIAQDDPAVRYAAFVMPGNDPSGINVGLLVRDTVNVYTVRQFGKDLTFTYNATTYTTFDRPPLVLECSYHAGPAGFPFTVIAVHQRSLSGIDGSSGGFVRAKRLEGARVLAETIQAMQAVSPDIHLIVAGDFNAFEFTDGYVDVLGEIKGAPDPAGALLPATDLVEPDLTDQALTLPPSERYSFVEGGNAQVLDHILTSRALAGYVRDVEMGRGNADAPAASAADSTTALRAADHDGMVLYLETVRRPRRVLNHTH